MSQKQQPHTSPHASHPTVLTIAGSDSSGGAGIQADLKTMAMLGAYGASVITALTAQNSRGVHGVLAIEPGFVREQLDAVFDDLTVDGIKTGMLFSAPIIKEVAAALSTPRASSHAGGPPLVVDPVSVAASGDSLLQPEAVRALTEKLIPLATLVTPNRMEAESLTGVTITDQEDIFTALDKLLAMGPRAVLIKGGHLDEFGAVTDWLQVDGEKPLPLIHPRVDTKNIHGTGCTLASAIAVLLARGLSTPAAVQGAQAYVNLGLRASFAVGEGPGPVNHMAPLIQSQARGEVAGELWRAASNLSCAEGLARLAPLRGMNLCALVPWSADPYDAVAFEGGLATTLSGRIHPCGPARPGADARLARVALSAREVDSAVSCVAVLRYEPDIAERLRQMEIGVVDVKGERTEPGKEPDTDSDPEAFQFEASPSPASDHYDWRILAALRSAAHATPISSPPLHAVAQRGLVGRDPVIYLFAHSLQQLVSRITALL